MSKLDLSNKEKVAELCRSINGGLCVRELDAYCAANGIALIIEDGAVTGICGGEA